MHFIGFPLADFCYILPSYFNISKIPQSVPGWTARARASRSFTKSYGIINWTYVTERNALVPVPNVLYEAMLVQLN